MVSLSNYGLGVDQAKGQEATDAQAKEWGIGSKAKAPAENKGK